MEEKVDVPYIPNSIVGYHGTSVQRAMDDLRSGRVHKSIHSGDWLGHGAYFWEGDMEHAVKWAKGRYGADSAVLKAKINLSRCLDLSVSLHTRLLKVAYDKFCQRSMKEHKAVPVNSGEDHNLDCCVVNYLAKELMNLDTIRAPFYEGQPVFPGSKILDLSHIQVVVLNDSCLSEQPTLVYGRLEKSE